MKIAALFATVALAQDDFDGRAMSLNKKIDNAGKKCSVYMEKAFSCSPPKDKIGKYNFRLEKVLKDAQHHLSVGKCDEGGAYYDNSYGRKRRETTEELEAEFDALMSEIDDGFDGKGYGGSGASQGQVDKLESLCSKFINLVFADDSLANCGKLGAWQKRADQLFGDMVAMKNVCLKADQEDSQQGGGYNGGSTPKPTQAAYKQTPKPTKKPTNTYNGKPTKKPKTKKPKY